ncbi:MAG: YciI family protein [Rhizobiaceae bacterium]
MAKFVFAYHGGKMPETPEEGAKAMAAWENWFKQMGSAVIDGGNPVGKSKTVTANGVEDNGGANPLSGYSLVEADSIDAAIEMAKGCPILDGGTVEVAEAMEM